MPSNFNKNHIFAVQFANDSQYKTPSKSVHTEQRATLD
jgi:hypothetical protein